MFVENSLKTTKK